MRRGTCLAALCLLAWLPAATLADDLFSGDKLDRTIRGRLEDFGVTGLALAIVKDDQVVFMRGYGVKDTGTGEPVTPDSLFNIASCSKAITAAAMAMLVEDEHLQWNDRVVDFLPGFRLADPYITENLNIVDILSHRSGLGTFYGDLLWYETDYDNQEIIRRMRFLPITNEFRSQYGYQNNLYMVAGEIIREITGKTWTRFLNQRIFAPLDMTETKSSARDLTPGQDVAMPHLQGERVEISFVRPFAAGSIFSSARDMSNWTRMLLANGQWKGRRLLQAETVQELFKPRIPLPVSSLLQEHGVHFQAYALGWGLFDYAGRKIVQHAGGMPGYISKVCLVPEEKLGMVILTNDQNRMTVALQLTILDAFLGGDGTDWMEEMLQNDKEQEGRQHEQLDSRDESRVPGTTPSLALEAYQGNYTDRMYGDALVANNEGTLHLTLLPAKDHFVSPLEHWHHDTFRIQFPDRFLPAGFVTFSLDSKARVTGFTIDLPNPDFHFHNLDFVKESAQDQSR